MPFDLSSMLSIQTDATYADIKIAYHRALLQSHPDKRNARTPVVDSVDISQIKEAYTTLSTPELRAKYDASRKQRPVVSGPRPAQVISLEEFEEELPTDPAGDECAWRHPCRCGGVYRISTEEMEKGQHLIGCNSCSEVIWAGYEPEESDDEGEV
ncbi:hypothetical protein BDQ12DRAFT_696558 [Crucibulum laeve]|uniref:Diphthamide biosynthesis protein 4 n=1 Tax=Crucibulum laeve TaxID=68775 RepID=A0A5C3MAY0_9AGAR|nr:hypothetical protein BDQ12DRAFT_696558 [Crucibulum laeve]